VAGQEIGVEAQVHDAYDMQVQEEGIVVPIDRFHDR
jgi:hypothetical protein